MNVKKCENHLLLLIYKVCQISVIIENITIEETYLHIDHDPYFRILFFV